MTGAFCDRDFARDVEAWIESLGLDRPPSKGSDSWLPRARRLRHCLNSTGPVFSNFGLYLSTRGDLFPGDFCSELAELPETAVRSEYTDVRSVFRQELGCDPERAFAYFEPEPYDCRLFWQAHRARLGNSNVVVRVIHSRAAALAEQAGALKLLLKPLSYWNAQRADLERAVVDYGQEITQSCDFEQELQTSELLARDATEFELLFAPRLHRHLCTRLVTVNEECDVLTGQSGIARTLCLVWLRQALYGTSWPVYPRACAVVSPDGRVSFSGGTMTVLSEPARTHLGKYLEAVSAENADECATQLCALYSHCLSNSDSDEIRRRVRQMVPFREAVEAGIPGGLPARELRFTNEILIHWRLVSQVRVFDDPAVVNFFRGLQSLSRTVQQLAPGRDSIAEGYRDLRIVSVFGELKKLIRPADMAALAGTYATAFLRTPGEAAEMLRATAANRDCAEPNKAAPDRSESFSTVASVLLAFASMALLAQKLESVAGHTLPQGALPLLIVAAGIYVVSVCRRIARRTE